MISHLKHWCSPGQGPMELGAQRGLVSELELRAVADKVKTVQKPRHGQEPKLEARYVKD